MISWLAWITGAAVPGCEQAVASLPFCAQFEAMLVLLQLVFFQYFHHGGRQGDDSFAAFVFGLLRKNPHTGQILAGGNTGRFETAENCSQRVILSVSEESFNGTIPVLRLSGEDPSSPAATQDDKSDTFSVVTDGSVVTLLYRRYLQ